MYGLRILIAAVVLAALSPASQAALNAWGSVDWDTNTTTDAFCWWDDAATPPVGETPKAFSGWYAPGPVLASQVKIQGPYTVTVTDTGNVANKIDLTKPATIVETPDKPYTDTGHTSLVVQAGADLTVTTSVQMNADKSLGFNHSAVIEGTLTAGTSVIAKNETGGTGLGFWNVTSTGYMKTAKLSFVGTANFDGMTLTGRVSPIGVIGDETGTMEVSTDGTHDSGIFVVDMAGTAAGDFDVYYFKNKALTLAAGGTMEINFLGGYVPNNGDSFLVAAAKTTLGLDPAYAITGDGAGLWQAAVVPYAGSLTGVDKALQLTYVVPEPASLALLGLAGLLLFGRRHD